MRRVEQTDSGDWFFLPFFKTGKGQIFGLATPISHIRDGLALTQLARFFPLPEFEGILVEPGRPTVLVAENIILVGSATLFIRSDAHPVSGREEVLSVGEAKLGARLEKIYPACCYRLTVDGERQVVNDVTGRVHAPRLGRETESEVDYGVIRRLFRGPAENTIVVEGVHRLGTLGAAKVATSRIYLDAIREAVSRLDGFKDSLPLEILVRSTYQPGQDQGVFSLDTIKAEPLSIVYNRHWTYDLVDDQTWTDQLPWDLHVRVAGQDRPVLGQEETQEAPLPRLELRAELGQLDHRVEALCRRIFVARVAREAERRRLLERLTALSDHFRIQLVSAESVGSAVSVIDLPQGRSTLRRRVRTQFLLHLVLCRFLGLRFRYDDASIARIFPRFDPGRSSRSRSESFVLNVRGKLSEGFEPLLGTSRKPSHYLRIDRDKREKIYDLQLDRATLVLELRF